MTVSTYSDICKFIYDLPKFTQKHSPQESREFLQLLGNPEQDMRIIHVAGTNGKGSICAYMESILLHAGFHTGCFISPHLEDMRERVRIDSDMCSEEDFVWAFNEVLNIAEANWYPTFFEFLFYVGLLIFQKEKVDILILETGLGGRLDATNLPDNKELSIITSIGYDHMEYLGNTLPEIAYEKAGIMRQGVPAVYWRTSPSGINDDEEVAKKLQECAQNIGADVYALDSLCVSDIYRTKAGIDFCISCKYHSSICLTVETQALYQVDNASLAVISLMIWDKDGTIADEDYALGLKNVKWQGRMEEVAPRIFLDGAHNIPGIQAFINSIKEDEPRHRLLIFGCMKDKQYEKEIELLTQSNLFERVIVTKLESDRSLSISEAARCFANAGVKVVQEMELVQAVEEAKNYSACEDQYVYIAGSLYLVGEIRGFIL